VISGWHRFGADYVNAVSEANGTTVPVGLDIKSSLSIQPSEGSRSRARRTRGAMVIQSIFAWKALPDGDFVQKLVIDSHRCGTSDNHASSYRRRHPLFKGGSSEAGVYTRGSVRRASGFLLTGNTEDIWRRSERELRDRDCCQKNHLCFSPVVFPFYTT